MYKVIFIALLLILPSVLAHSSPYEELYEIGKRMSIRSIVNKLIHDPRIHTMGCAALCGTITGGWLAFLCPTACDMALKMIG